MRKHMRCWAPNLLRLPTLLSEFAANRRLEIDNFAPKFLALLSQLIAHGFLYPVGSESGASIGHPIRDGFQATATTKMDTDRVGDVRPATG